MKISRPFSFVKLGRFCSNRSWNVKGLRFFLLCIVVYPTLCKRCALRTMTDIICMFQNILVISSSASPKPNPSKSLSQKSQLNPKTTWKTLKKHRIPLAVGDSTGALNHGWNHQWKEPRWLSPVQGLISAHLPVALSIGPRQTGGVL